MKQFRFGILGAGTIAGRMMKDFETVPGAKMQAVASRELEKAKNFAKFWGIEQVHEGYEALYSNSQVDIIYVATPHPFHYEQVMAALQAGKHVLCEKPMAMNSRQLKAMCALAKAKNLFLMEAMWTRMFPGTLKVLELVRGGAIGKLQGMHAQFSFPAPYSEYSRLHARHLGGGALLDVGCYPIHYAIDIFGHSPVDVQGLCSMNQEQVDAQDAIILRFKEGAVATLFAGITAAAPVLAMVYGEKGYIEIPDFYHPSHVTLYSMGKQAETFTFSFKEEGFAYEIDHVCQCIGAGLTQSPRMPLQDSLTAMEVMDALRAKWGVIYAADVEGKE